MFKRKKCVLLRKKNVPAKDNRKKVKVTAIVITLAGAICALYKVIKLLTNRQNKSDYFTMNQDDNMPLEEIYDDESYERYEGGCRDDYENDYIEDYNDEF